MDSTQDQEIHLPARGMAKLAVPCPSPLVPASRNMVCLAPVPSSGGAPALGCGTGPPHRCDQSLALPEAQAPQGQPLCSHCVRPMLCVDSAICQRPMTNGRHHDGACRIADTTNKPHNAW